MVGGELGGELGRSGENSLAAINTLQSVVSPTQGALQGALPGLSFGGNRYQLTSSALTWEAAQAEAVRLGGNLVTINDAAEQRWLETAFGTSETLWTGLTDRNQEGTFAWVSGEAVTFTNWAEGQPQQDPFAQDYAEREDYATFNFNRTPFWADFDGSARYRGIIEISGIQPVESPRPPSGVVGNSVSNPSPQGTDLLPSELSKIVVRGDVTKPQLFLTFDDGPVESQTSEILDVLDQFNVKASFFLVGQQVQNFPQESRRIAQTGHVIGNHSFFHANNPNAVTGEIQGLRALSFAEARDELLRTNQVIQSVTGQETKYFRAPFGFFNDDTHRASDQLGLKFVDLIDDGDTRDWKPETSVDEVVRVLLDNAANGYIFALHDHGRATVEALRIAIPQLQARGFEFVTLDALPSNP